MKEGREPGTSDAGDRGGNASYYSTASKKCRITDKNASFPFILLSGDRSRGRKAFLCRTLVGLRLFTAIDIPADVKAALAALLDRLRPLADLRWIPLEKLHITTKFIGEWPEDRLDELKAALASVQAPAPVDIVIRGLGKLPRILYAAVEPNQALTALAAATERAVGVPAEDRAETRVYRPHITLARSRKPVPRIDFEQSTIGSFRASSFALYLSAAGKYTKLQEFPFTT